MDGCFAKTGSGQNTGKRRLTQSGVVVSLLPQPDVTTEVWAHITKAKTHKALGDRALAEESLLHAKKLYLLRPTLVYKPKFLNRDWSPRFSTLRDKNGWI